MRSKRYWAFTSDIKLWVKRERLLWWAQSRTWRKSLSSWWNLTGRLGTWSDERRATKPSQLFSLIPGFQAQLSDAGLAVRDTCSCALQTCLRQLFHFIFFFFYQNLYYFLRRTKPFTPSSVSQYLNVLKSVLNKQQWWFYSFICSYNRVNLSLHKWKEFSQSHHLLQISTTVPFNN